MGSRARCPNEIQAELGSGLCGLDVEVEQHLEVIRDEADRGDHDVRQAAGGDIT